MSVNVCQRECGGVPVHTHDKRQCSTGQSSEIQKNTGSNTDTSFAFCVAHCQLLWETNWV